MHQLRSSSPLTAVLSGFSLFIITVLLIIEADASVYQAHLFPRKAVAGDGATVVEINVDVGPTATVSFACNQPEFSFLPTSVTGTGTVTVGHAGFEGLADLTATIDDGEMVLNKTVTLFIDKASGDSTTSKVLLAKGDSCNPGGMPPRRYDSIALGHQSIAATAKVIVRLELTYTVCPATYDLVSVTGACTPQPVDECALGTHNCDIHATCTNAAGSFTCACNTGYAGTGATVPVPVGPGCLCLQPSYAYVGAITTLAGSGTVGYLNGNAATARFQSSGQLAVDEATGDVYITSVSNHCIRKITSTGDVSLFTGSGTTTGAFADGTLAAARFSGPRGILVEAATGAVFVGDMDNHRVRRILGGVVTTFAGDGTAGHVDGSGDVARFNFPLGLALDANGNLFVADYSNHAIRKITSSGVVSSIAGDLSTGTGTDTFGLVSSLTLDVSGNIFVGDGAYIRKIAPDNTVTIFAGNGAHVDVDAVGTNAGFDGAWCVKMTANGNILVGERGGHTVRQVTPDGNVSTILGSGSVGYNNGVGTAATFGAMYGIDFDANENMFIADTSNYRVRKVTATCPA